MTVGERITQLLSRKNFSKKYIEEKSTIKDETVRNYQNDVSPPKFVFIAWLFKEFPDLNHKWLFFGEEPMFIDLYKLSNQDHERRIKKVEGKLDQFQSTLINVIGLMEKDKQLKEDLLKGLTNLEDN